MSSFGKTGSSTSAADVVNSSKGMGGIGRIGCGCIMGRRVDEFRVAPGVRPIGIASASEDDDEFWYNAEVGGANNVVIELELSWVYEEL